MPRIHAFKPPAASADEPAVGATWKLRVIVYGLLAAIAALVLVARPGEPRSAKPESLRTLRGTTEQGSRVAIALDGRHVRVASISHLTGACGPRISWQPAVGLIGVTYRERGEWVRLSQRWQPEYAWMRARVYNGGHNIDGKIAFSDGTCAPLPIGFTASG